jgi:acyl dehydratase
MPMNPDLAGKTYAATRFEVTAERVAAFAAAVGNDGSSVPPTFATAPEIEALAQVIGDPDLGLDLTRVVHGEQEFEWRRPLAVGDSLTVTPTIASIRAKGGHGFITIETEMRDGVGELVVVSRNTMIVRGGAP